MDPCTSLAFGDSAALWLLLHTRPHLHSSAPGRTDSSALPCPTLPAGDLQALLLGREGTKLLGIPAQCLSDATVVQELRSRLESLATVDEGGGVWIDAALTPLYAAQPGQQQQQVEEAQQQPQQQEACDQQQLQLVPFEQAAGVDAQQQQQQEQAQASQPLQPEQQHQQPQVGPPAASLPPVFLLHDAALRSEDVPELGAALEDEEEGEGDEEEDEEQEEEAQQQQASQDSPHAGSPARTPPSEAKASPGTRRKRRRGDGE